MKCWKEIILYSSNAVGWWGVNLAQRLIQLTSMVSTHLALHYQEGTGWKLPKNRGKGNELINDQNKIHKESIA